MRVASRVLRRSSAQRLQRIGKHALRVDTRSISFEEYLAHDLTVGIDDERARVRNTVSAVPRRIVWVQNIERLDRRRIDIGDECVGNSRRVDETLLKLR